MKAKKLSALRDCKDVQKRTKFRTEFDVYDTPTHITFHIMEGHTNREKINRYRDWISTLELHDVQKKSHMKELDEWLDLCDEFMCDVDIYWM
jgi:hypothetical protein